MQELSIMEFVKWFIALLVIMMLISLAMFFIELSNVNSFKQQVNYQIERQGGLTNTAISNINQTSNDYYNGTFTVISDRLNTKVAYGEPVDYVVKGTFDIKILPIPDVKLEFNGTGVSQVR
ncbi:hypothetical protein [Peribacillus aracenensis]|uniref:hypothetical protein n=1 Tax=Peribacillus aracenensis TaxID=2976708 RepID=UPI0021A6CA3B|nr:hypothetical protein [Peribacillus sp. BBB004]